MDTLTAELTPQVLADILQEPEKALLAKVLRQLGQERCAAILADTLEVEANGGMLLKDGSRRKSPGGVFFQLTKNACTGKERYYLFRHTPAKRPSSSAGDRPPTSVSTSTGSTSPAHAAAQPCSVACHPHHLWKGLTPMPVTATLKLVLRDLPETRERDGMVYLALQNEPRGVPQNIAWTQVLSISRRPAKQWKTACTKAAEIRATGSPALLIIEAHVSTKEGALIGVVKGVQVVEGKAPVASSA